MDQQSPPSFGDNVIDLFSHQPYNGQCSRRIVRLCPELDSLEMLYSNDHNPNKLFSMKILCWAMRSSGEVVALVPWLNDIVACTQINDPLNGHWEGYYDSARDRIFFEPPDHKVIELETALDYYGYEYEQDLDNPVTVQEIPDNIGTHAVFTQNNFHDFSLHEVLSWRLLDNGEIHAMMVDEDKITNTPVLPGDSCLYPAQPQPGFRYFFHHRIANKIKSNDPDALAAFALLVDN